MFNSLHFRHLLKLKYFIIIGSVSLLITLMLLYFSDDLLHRDSALRLTDRTHKLEAQSVAAPFQALDDDKKMFHWLSDEKAEVKKAANNSKNLAENSGQTWLMFQHDTRPPLTAPRILKYCNPPLHYDQGNEGMVSEDYTLLNVHVVIRHGDRSPISRLPKTDPQDLSCVVDVSQFSHIPKVNNFVPQMAQASHQVPEGSKFYRWSLYPTSTRCTDGQLTGRGALQHVLYGMHYSTQYYQKHGLFNENNWHKQIAAFTTEVQRTYQSAIAFLYGLLPSFNIEKLKIKAASNINFCDKEIVGVSCSCSGIEVFRNKAAKECKKDEGFIQIMKDYETVVNYISNILSIQHNEMPHVATVMDGLSGYACHNINPPCSPEGSCITAKAVESVWAAIDHQSNCLHRNENYKKFCKVSMHGLLHRIAQKMASALKNQTVESFHLYSGHDTTLSPLITALELDDAVWPGYASRMTFELYRQKSTSKPVFRVLQNGKVVTSQVVFCRNHTQDEFCPYSHFFKYVTSSAVKDFCDSIKFPAILRPDVL